MPTALLWLLVAWFGAVVSGYYMRRWRESSARECDEVLVFYRRELEQSIARCGG